MNTRQFYDAWKDVPGSDVILLLAAKKLKKCHFQRKPGESKLEHFDRLSKEAKERQYRKTGAEVTKESKVDIKRDPMNSDEMSHVSEKVTNGPPPKRAKYDGSDDSFEDCSFVTTNVTLSSEEDG